MAAASFPPVGGGRFRRLREDASARAFDRGLIAAGASVEKIPGSGGRPDRLVGFNGRTVLLEYKTEGHTKTTGSARAHLAKQAAWRASWRGGPVAVVETLEQALRAVGAVP